jgi:hypothetical protein
MTDHIADDLAALGRRARDRLPSVVATIERLAPRGDVSAERALVVLARVFSARVARGAAGATALLLMAVVSTYLAFNHDGNGWNDGWVDRLVYGPQFALWGIALCTVMTVYWLAIQVAVRRFDRAIASGDVVARARVLVDRVAGWTLGLAVAGAMAYVLVFGMLYVVLAVRPLRDIAGLPAGAEGVLRVKTVVMLFVLLVAAVAGGFLSVRRIPVRGAALVGGIVLLLTTMALGLRFDSGLLGPRYRHAGFDSALYFGQPPDAFDGVRIALTCAGTVAVFLIIGGAFSRRHRREVAGL